MSGKRPLSYGDIIALMLTRDTADSETVTVARNARGVFQFEVTCRTRKGETVEEAFERATGTVGQLVARFPYEPEDEKDKNLRAVAGAAAAIARNKAAAS